MAQYLLQKGDIIRLEKGMKVYAVLPAIFQYYRITSPSTVGMRTDIKIGTVYHRDAVSKDNLVSQLVESIDRVIEVTEKQVSAFVDSLNPDLSAKDFDTSIYAGEYIVDRVFCNGGGTQSCMSGGFESWPDGWHVFCTKQDDPSIKVDFYQTGSFTAMIPDITPINVTK